LPRASSLLGTFNYDYVAHTARPQSAIAGATGQKTEFSWSNALNDLRLSQIHHVNGATSDTLSLFGYKYDVLGRITQWTKQQSADSADAQVDTADYDKADRLTSINTSFADSNPVRQSNWRFDKAWNRLNEQLEDNAAGCLRREQYAVNNVNELLSTTAGGPVHVSGSLDEQGRFSLSGQPTQVTDAHTSFSLWADSSTTNTFVLDASDWSSNQSMKTGQFTPATNVPARSFSYDVNGNTTQMIVIESGTTHTTDYTWDARDQLVAVDQDDGTTRSELTYDGFGRRVQIVEKATAPQRAHAISFGIV
jgi:YD repeat-containing protein